MHMLAKGSQVSDSSNHPTHLVRSKYPPALHSLFFFMSYNLLCYIFSFCWCCFVLIRVSFRVASNSCSGNNSVMFMSPLFLVSMLPVLIADVLLTPSIFIIESLEYFAEAFLSSPIFLKEFFSDCFNCCRIFRHSYMHCCLIHKLFALYSLISKTSSSSYSSLCILHVPFPCFSMFFLLL